MAQLNEEFQALMGALNELVVGQRRHVKPPETYKPEKRQEGLAQWTNWRFAFENFISASAIDGEVLRLMKIAEREETIIAETSMGANAKEKFEKLYSMLTMLLRNRPLRLTRGVAGQNGLEAWPILTKDLQPKTRQRSLALILALSRVQFDASKTINEQFPHFELFVREYEKAARVTYPEGLKVASVLAALPGNLRLHVQMALDENTTYEDIKQRSDLFEAVNTRWSADSTLHQFAVKPVQQDGQASNHSKEDPMEVDAVVAKAKKGGKKGKKGDAKGKSKGKSWWQKDGGKKGVKKGKGKNDSKGGKSGKGGICHNCGKPVHFARDCWSPIEGPEGRRHRDREHSVTGVNYIPHVSTKH
jgi:hypothetical protein